jgi:hypothetical protein
MLVLVLASFTWVLYSGKITRGGNFRFIRDHNTSPNLRNSECYQTVKCMCDCLENKIREFKNPQLCLNKKNCEYYNP